VSYWATLASFRAEVRAISAPMLLVALVESTVLPASGTGVAPLNRSAWEVRTHSGGEDGVEHPIREGRGQGKQTGLATDGIAGARLARRHYLGDHLGRP
jgi:hypothetical protein